MLGYSQIKKIVFCEPNTCIYKVLFVWKIIVYLFSSNYHAYGDTQKSDLLMILHQILLMQVLHLIWCGYCTRCRAYSVNIAREHVLLLHVPLM